MTAVTVLGLGPMGRALAGAFIDNGHPTTVWNRTPGKAGDLLARGATTVDTAAEAVAASQLVVVCVLDYAAVRAIVEPVADALKGRTLVNLTADSPDRAREMAAWAAGHGVDYLDGSIMTPVAGIGTPDALVLYSGPIEVPEALASLGGSATHLGTDPGRAAAYDVALLDLFWTTMTGYVHALALARSQDIAARDLAPYAQGIVGLMGDIIPAFAEQVDDGHHPGEASTVVSAAAGMDHVIHAAEAAGLDTGVLRAARAAVQRAIDAGHGGEDFSVVTSFASDGGPRSRR